jgi:hypothetical protein
MHRELKIDLDPAQLKLKIHLLALANLGFQNIGQNPPYVHVVVVLQVTLAEVEHWIVNDSPSLHPFLPPLFRPVLRRFLSWTGFGLWLSQSHTAIREGFLTGK